MEQKVLNFDIAIEESEEGRFVRVLDAPAGPAVISWSDPFTAEGRSQLFQQLADAPSTSPADQQLLARSVGERLYRALLSGNTLRAWQQSQYLAYQAQSRLRLRLHPPARPALIHLPWELLFDPERNEFVALGNQTQLVRYVELRQQILPWPTQLPLRALVILSNPSSYPAFDAERTWLAQLDALDYLALEGKLILERLTKPTIYDLQKRLRQNDYHLLHFIGHSLLDGYTQDGQLVFGDETGRGRLVSGQHLGALVREHHTLRLVLLNAPESTPIIGPSPYTNIAYSLVNRGTPAVITAQLPLTAAGLLTYVSHLYPALADLQPVDMALIATRRALRTEMGDMQWGAPLLITRTADGRLFEQHQAKTPTIGILRQRVLANR
jgi:CHAT domain-containing protein